MPTWGVTPAGFFAKPLAQIESEIDAALQNGPLGKSAGTNPDGTIPLDSLAGQIKAFLVDGFSAQWDLQQAVFSSFDPTQSTDAAQDAVYAITGIKREAARYSTVTAVCTGTPGTVLQAGRVASVAVTGTRFDSEADATITAVSAWQAGHPYIVGARVTNGGNVYQCVDPGTSATAPTGTTISTAASPAIIVDGTAGWIYIGSGTGAVDVPFVAEKAGAYGALSGMLVNIATPVAGWGGVFNLYDAQVGTAQESNAAFRQRREAELAVSGASTVDAVRAKILAVNQGSTDPLHAPPASCTVFANTSDVTDTTGLPPHSVEAVVLGGTDQDIAEAIWNAIPAGIGTHGNVTSTVIDSQGNPQTVSWSRPTTLPIIVHATVYYDPTKWPAIGATAAVQNSAMSAILTLGANFPVGQSVRPTVVSAAIFDGPQAVDGNGLPVAPAPPESPPMPGVVDTTITVGLTADTLGNLVPITPRQIAIFSSENITITAIPEAP